MDFTLSKYEQLLRFLKDKGYDLITVTDYLEQDFAGPFVVMRHDVDRMKKNTIRMAELESSVGMNSTYYFRYPNTFDVDLMKKVSALGHEVGYHYEALSKAKGDEKQALKLFEKELSEFKEHFDVKTISMHGAPLSGVNNQDLADMIDMESFGLKGDAISSINDTELVYFNDTGRRWDDKYNIRDKLDESETTELKSTDDLIRYLEKKKFRKIYINTHPERWSDNVVVWMYKYVMDVGFNFGKRVVKGGIK